MARPTARAHLAPMRGRAASAAATASRHRVALPLLRDQLRKCRRVEPRAGRVLRQADGPDVRHRPSPGDLLVRPEVKEQFGAPLAPVDRLARSRGVLRRASRQVDVVQDHPCAGRERGQNAQQIRDRVGVLVAGIDEHKRKSQAAGRDLRPEHSPNVRRDTARVHGRAVGQRRGHLPRGIAHRHARVPVDVRDQVEGLHPPRDLAVRTGHRAKQYRRGNARRRAQFNHRPRPDGPHHVPEKHRIVEQDCASCIIRRPVPRGQRGKAVRVFSQSESRGNPFVRRKIIREHGLALRPIGRAHKRAGPWDDGRGFHGR